MGFGRGTGQAKEDTRGLSGEIATALDNRPGADNNALNTPSRAKPGRTLSVVPVKLQERRFPERCTWTFGLMDRFLVFRIKLTDSLSYL